MELSKSKKTGNLGKHTVVFVPITCGKTHKIFYARYDKAYSGKWVLTYGLERGPSSNEKSIASLKIDISDSLLGPQYKCPFCGARNFVRCRVCERLTCFEGGQDFKCAHCGHHGNVSRTKHIKDLDGSSGGGQ